MATLKDNKALLTFDDVKSITEAGGVADGTRGGLISGNSHAAGGIKVIRRHQHSDEFYEIVAEFEGWEFIMNPFATTKEIDYLTKLNSACAETEGAFLEFEIPRD